MVKRQDWTVKMTEFLGKHRVQRGNFIFFFFFLNLFLYIFWLCHMAYGILVPQLGIEPKPLAVRAWSLNHWTTREFPSRSWFKKPWGKKKKAMEREGGLEDFETFQPPDTAQDANVKKWPPGRWTREELSRGKAESVQFFLKTSQRTSSVAQWIRVHLPMWGTPVRSLVQEDSTGWGATKPMCLSTEPAL